jgi:hypothetical protein
MRRFKTGDKIVCIIVKEQENLLTLYKTYIVAGVDTYDKSNIYSIYIDFGTVYVSFLPEYFVSLSKFRKMKIKSLYERI